MASKTEHGEEQEARERVGIDRHMAIFVEESSLWPVTLAVVLAGWRPEQSGSADASLPAGSVAYSATALNDLRTQGRPVFVDVTADWCITCLANERTVLGSDKVQQAFRDAGVTYMVADWTDYDPDIAEFVASHGRSGIPLYVLYDGREAPRLDTGALSNPLVGGVHAVAGHQVIVGDDVVWNVETGS